jgi:histidinol-phosphatase
MNPSPELQAALDAADEADRIVQGFYQHNAKVTIKADKSPVTEADLAVEHAIKKLLEARFPDHGFYGEETGKHRLEADSLWLVDPIDGTKAFVREYPMFSTQIALKRGRDFVVGVSSAPVYGERCWAERGGGAWLNGQRVRVNAAAGSVEAATISVGNMKSLALGPQWRAYGQMIARAHRIRGYGDFLHYHLLASGKIDVVIETDIVIFDVAACVAIVNEAGGRCTQLDGEPLTVDSTTMLATNGPMHPVVLEALAP